MKRKFLYLLMFALLVGGVFFALRPSNVLAIEPGVYLVTDPRVRCSSLADDPFFDNITSPFGFKINAQPIGDNLVFTLTEGTQNGYPTVFTGGAPSDPINNITITSDGVYFDWTSTIGMDAVIVKAQDSNAYVYVPEAYGAIGLHPPEDKNISHIEFCYDYELTARKTAEAGYTRTYTWEITKSVDPETHTGWFGDEFTSTYNVSVNQTVVDSAYQVSGEITVNNPTPFAVTFDVADDVNGTTAAVNCPTNDLAANDGGVGGPDEVTCTYVADLGDVLPPDGTNTATVTSLNADVDGATANADYTFSEPTNTVGYPTINVTDYFDGDTVGESLGEASGDDSYGYTRTFQCPTAETEYTDGVYTALFHNDAYIDETGQTDFAEVNLTCYKPLVSKDASTEWYEEYTWTITKSVFPSTHTGYPGDVFSSSYTVEVNRTQTPSGYRAFGSIFVTNPSDEEITVDVADEVNGTDAAVDCDGFGATNLSVAAGETDSCSYTVDLDSTTQLLNTATVTFNGYNFHATADVIFGEPIEVGFPTINVTDYFDEDTTGEALGSVSGDFTFEYDRDFTCPTDGTEYNNGLYENSFPNHAEIDETGQKANASVDLTCTSPVKIKVIKEIRTGESMVGQYPFKFILVDPDGNEVETQTLNGAGEFEFNATVLAGEWKVIEVVPDGWTPSVLVNGSLLPGATTCELTVTLPDDNGKTLNCTFVNKENGLLHVKKLTNGKDDSQEEWKFGLYLGRSNLVASDSTPPVDMYFADYQLVPGFKYTLCEENLPAGWKSVWLYDVDGDGELEDVTADVYNPDKLSKEDKGKRCYDFNIKAGELVYFEINNRSKGGGPGDPGDKPGEPRTPGYWKVWNTCTGGNQAEVAAKNGGPEAGFWLLDDVLELGDITLGNITLTSADNDCFVAVKILDDRSQNSDKKMAKFADFKLARNLLAYELNQGADACPPTQEVLDAAEAAHQLLVEVGYDGIDGKLAQGDDRYQEALELATILDVYNNGKLCSPGSD